MSHEERHARLQSTFRCMHIPSGRFYPLGSNITYIRYQVAQEDVEQQNVACT